MPPDQAASDFGPSTQHLDTAPNRDALPPGMPLGGYRIVDVLAADEIGIVYLALDQSLQQTVVIKEYLPTALARRRADLQVALRSAACAAAFTEGLNAFLREAELLMRINHPSLIHVNSVWEAHLTAYMLMPFHEGKLLAAVLPKLSVAPDEPWVRGVMSGLLGALQALHAASWQHLSLAPDKILIQPDGKPILLGLGSVTRAIDAKKPPGFKPDTAPLDYTAPELLANGRGRGPIGPTTDLYALAAVMYHAIVGRPPRPAALRVLGDRMSTLEAALQAQAVNATGKQYSPGLLAAILRALSLDPAQRPQSVAAFETGLDTSAERQASVDETSAFGAAAAYSPGSDAPSYASANRRPGSGLRWLVAGVALVAIGVVGWQWQHARIPAQPTSPPATAAGTVTAAPAATPQPGRPMVLPADDDTPAPPPPSAPVAAQPAPVPAPAASVNEATGLAAQPARPATQVPAPPAKPVAPAPRPAPAPAAPAAQAEPDNPRAVCGPRSNFSLVYCMQTQCKRGKFASHPQCLQMRERGELD